MALAANPPIGVAGIRTTAQSLEREDLLEEDMATHSSVLGVENPKDTGDLRATVHGMANCQTPLRWLSVHTSLSTQLYH